MQSMHLSLIHISVKGLMNAAKGNAHVLVIVGVFLLLILMAVSYTHLDVYKRQYQNPVDLLFEELAKKKPNSFAGRQYKLRCV